MANHSFQVATYDQKFLLELGPRTEYILIGFKGYTHTQDVASSTWTIPHSLGYYPNVQLIDSTGVVFDAEVTHKSLNEVVIKASKPVAGFARLL